jgi:4-hydroxyacetophenone monooxygenase
MAKTTGTEHDPFEEASIPTLLMCLAQITGEDHWLQEPYLPRRDTNLFHDETGGLPSAVQDEVRNAARQVLQDIANNSRSIPHDIDIERFNRMMNVCVAEDVAPEYAPMLLEELGFVNRDVQWSTPSVSPNGFKVLIIGAGFAGICAAIKLQALGIPYVVVEKNSDIGGTWFDNNYPDAGVDTPNHFYSYSFAPNTKWKHYFSKRSDIWQYARDVAEKFNIISHIRFSTEVTTMKWNVESQTWTATITNSAQTKDEEFSAVITAVGQLNRPNLAPARGIENFNGDWFHSAHWNHSVDLSGKRVAVIGTGASAMQFMPTLAATAGDVTIFQRSPQWVRPNNDYHRTVSENTMWLLENMPFYAQWYRFGLFWRFGDGLLRTLRRDPEWQFPERSMNRHNDRHREQLTEHLLQELEGRTDLIEKCLPDYPPYGKRILVDNNWYSTLRRDNVHLVTSAVDRVTNTGIIDADGDKHDFDLIILATGFQAGNLLSPIDIRGVSGTPLRDVWGVDDPRAYLGITVPDYPNMFVLVGPNTFVAHGGSIIYQAECEMRYVTDCIRHMVEHGISSVEVKQDVHDEYNKRVDAEHDQLVWSHSGLHSWYRNSKGRVFSPMPWRFVDYWQMTHAFNESEYTVTVKCDAS